MPRNKLGESLATYLYDGSDTLCDLESAFYSLPDNGNNAFNTVEPQAMLGILLGAHDEPPQHIGNLLEKLEVDVRRPDMPPTSVIISCNAPKGKQNTALYHQNVRAIKEFQTGSDHDNGSQLAVSFFERAYPKGTTQGKRRKDLGDVAMLHAWQTYQPNHFPPKMSFMMLDVDTEDVHPGSLAKLHAAIERGQPVATPRIKHHVDAAYPRLARALRFEEALFRLIPTGGFDGYMMFDMAKLADMGGYPAEPNTGEVQELIKQHNLEPYIVPQTQFATSSRRIHAEYLGGQTLFHKCWPSFSATEAYRLGPPTIDIDAEHMQKSAVMSLRFARVYTLGERSKAYQKNYRLPGHEAFCRSVQDIAKRARVANYLFGLGIEGSKEYTALQEAAKKYCIV